MSAVDFTFVTNVVLFSFSESAGTYDEFGPVSCALIGSKAGDTTFKIGCYRDNKYICTASVLPSNDAGAQVARDGVYVTFHDEKSHYWSLQFSSEDGAVEFCAQVAVAMFGAAGEPTDSLLTCDVAKGKENKQVFVGDLVKAFYRAWVVQPSGSSEGLPRLGSLLEKECEDAVKFTAPASHQSVTAAMRGFEGMAVGMREGGQRLVVVPAKAKRGRGPNVHMCFYVEVSRRKDQQSALQSHSQRAAKEREPLLLQSAGHLGEPAQPLALTAGHHEDHPATAINGFSKEQFLLVDRLRDQVFTLTEQLRDTRRQLDGVCADLKRHERQSSTRSLTSAQIEYSIEHLLVESEAKKAAVEDKRAVIGVTEARNRELEARLAKFLQTTKTLGEEAKAASDDSAGERIELDRQLGDTQARIVRLDGELGDSSRHLQALKNVLRANDVRLKEEKVRLSVSVSDHQVNEEKLHVLQENYGEEAARRRLLESKLVTLQEELRRLQDDAQLKESLTQQIRAKMESDSVHYTQLIQQEREQAAIELRQLKQDLVEELAARDRQYGEAKEGVAAEAYEQGMAQGVEEGLADAANEGDVIAHDMAVNAQRSKAEAAALQVRVQANRAANEADERHFTSQVESLQASVTRALRDINSLAAQVEAAKEEHAVKVGEMYQRLTRLVRACGAASISQPCLAAMMRASESGAEFDPFSFQPVEAAREAQLAREERVAVSTWVRASVYNQPARMPPLRPPFPYAASSKGPLLSADALGTKVLLSPPAQYRLSESAAVAAPRPLPAPTAARTEPPAQATTSTPALVPVPAAPPSPAATAPLSEALGAQQGEPRGGTSAVAAPRRQRVQFPSTRVRYLVDGGVGQDTAAHAPQRPPPL
ncbi:hypothetical protein NESM_000462900 [Novymonas esmeraldas]|uniref:Peptidylprolyl isomerase n=1 Tax=Novymonas esmeraldas TaxID=1808958 RepID=A0AAW0EMT9_9TRYP